MKSKISIFLVIALSLVLMVTSVSADTQYTVSVADIKDSVISVSGTTDAQDVNDINILVLNPDNSIQYQWTAEIEENGSFSHSFPFNLSEDFEKGTFTFYVGGNGNGTPVSKTFTFSSFEKRLEAAYGIYQKLTAADIDFAEAAEYLTDAADLLAVCEAFGEVSAKSVAIKLAASFEENPIEFGDVNSDDDAVVEMQIAAIEQLVKEVNRISVLQAFCEGKSSVLFDSKGNIKVNDYINLTGRVSGNTTLIDALANISDEGISAINSDLMGVDVADEDELAKNYAFAIILNGIKYNEQFGYNYVASLLTKDNAQYAGLEIPDYLALGSATDDANSQIVSKKSSLTKANLASVIEEAAESEDDEPVRGSSSGGSSGGFGGGSKVTVMEPAEPINPQTGNSANGFNDIASCSWAVPAIEALTAKGVIAGIGEGKFNPDGQLTREQAVKIVCLALGFTANDSSAAFADEVSGAWYAPYLAIARANGIANGQGDNVFGIGNAISRQDFAVMLYRALKIEDSSVELYFADADEISDYAKKAVAYLSSRKVISGYTDGTFKPAAPISRAEAAKLVYELIK